MSTELIEQPKATTTDLRAIGLSEHDLPRVIELSTALADVTPAKIQAFGREASKNTAAFADTMLEEVRNGDLESTGKQLGEVVRLARNIDLKQISNRSNIPVLGALINRFRATRGDLVQNFTSTRAQIDQLVGDIGKTEGNLATRTANLDTMMEAVRDEHHEMGLHIAAGELALQDLRTRHAAQAAAAVNDPMQAQQHADLTAAINMLEKRVADLRVLQHAALQSMPTIRLIQVQNALLQDKFQNIKELTIPAWKRQFVLQLALNDQEQAAKLAKSIDDTTNSMMRASADLLRENAISAAKSNQRLVIDVETLQYVHTQLIETLQDVRKTNEEGLAKRREAEVKLLQLKKEVQAKLAGPSQQTMH